MYPGIVLAVLLGIFFVAFHDKSAAASETETRREGGDHSFG